MAVVKANAYGHGLIKTVNALADYADAFAVSRISEAVSIRKIGVSKPVLLLGGILDDKEAGQVAELGLWTAVHNQAQIRLLDGISKAAKLTIFLKVDADMNRLGFPLAEVAAATAALKSNPAIAEIVLMTHFANADVADGLSAPMAKIAPLHKLYNRVSLANSAAALLHGDINDDWGRIGIALYGSSPAPAWQNNKALGLRAVMTLTAPLLTVRQVKSGECVGYGSEWMADKPTKSVSHRSLCQRLSTVAKRRLCNAKRHTGTRHRARFHGNDGTGFKCQSRCKSPRYGNHVGRFSDN